MTLTMIEITNDEIEQLSNVFKVIGDQSRLKILFACFDEPTPVGVIAEKTGLSISLVSQHLRILKAVGIVRGVKEGRHVLYHIFGYHIDHILKDTLVHLRACVDDTCVDHSNQ